MNPVLALAVDDLRWPKLVMPGFLLWPFWSLWTTIWTDSRHPLSQANHSSNTYDLKAVLLLIRLLRSEAALDTAL